MDIVLEVQNLSRIDLFRNVSFEIPKERITVLSGSNMCGKTTLIKILSGILPTENTVLLERCFLESLPQEERLKKIAVLFSLKEMPFLMNQVEDEILFSLESLGLKKEEKKKKLEDVLQKFSLSALRKKSPQELTSYEKMKLFLGIVSLTPPKLLLLDEPCVMLTKEERKKFFQDLKKLKKEGISIFLTTSNLEDAIEADQLLILNQGKILLKGDPDTIFLEDGVLNRIGLQLPFLVDLSVKLQYYNLVDQIYSEEEKLVNAIWK